MKNFELYNIAVFSIIALGVVAVLGTLFLVLDVTTSSYIEGKATVIDKRINAEKKSSLVTAYPVTYSYTEVNEPILIVAKENDTFGILCTDVESFINLKSGESVTYIAKQGGISNKFYWAKHKK